MAEQAPAAEHDQDDLVRHIDSDAVNAQAAEAFCENAPEGTIDVTAQGKDVTVTFPDLSAFQAIDPSMPEE